MHRCYRIRTSWACMGDGISVTGVQIYDVFTALKHGCVRNMFSVGAVQPEYTRTRQNQGSMHNMLDFASACHAVPCHCLYSTDIFAVSPSGRSCRQLLQVDLQIKLPSVPVLPGVRELLEKGIQSTAIQGNSHFLQIVSNCAQLTTEQTAVLLDPQTSGAMYSCHSACNLCEAVSWC